MTRPQQVAQRNLERAQREWLHAYGWHETLGRWYHPRSQLTHGVTLPDAMAFTRAEPLRYGA